MQSLIETGHVLSDYRPRGDPALDAVIFNVKSALPAHAPAAAFCGATTTTPPMTTEEIIEKADSAFASATASLNAVADDLVMLVGDNVCAGSLFPNVGAIDDDGFGARNPNLPELSAQQAAQPVTNFSLSTLPDLTRKITVPMSITDVSALYASCREYPTDEEFARMIEQCRLRQLKVDWFPHLTSGASKQLRAPARYRWLPIDGESNANTSNSNENSGGSPRSNKTKVAAIVLPPFLTGSRIFSHFLEAEQDIRRRLDLTSFLDRHARQQQQNDDNSDHHQHNDDCHSGGNNDTPIIAKATRLLMFGQGEHIKFKDTDCPSNTSVFGGGGSEEDDALLGYMLVHLPLDEDANVYRFPPYKDSTDEFRYTTGSSTYRDVVFESDDDDDDGDDENGNNNTRRQQQPRRSLDDDDEDDYHHYLGNSTVDNNPLSRVRLKTSDLFQSKTTRGCTGGKARFFLSRKVTSRIGVVGPMGDPLRVLSNQTRHSHLLRPQKCEEQLVASVVFQNYSRSEVIDGEVPFTQSFANALACPLIGRNCSDAPQAPPMKKGELRTQIPLHFVAWRANVPFDILPLESGYRVLVLYELRRGKAATQPSTTPTSTSSAPRAFLLNREAVAVKRLKETIIPSLQQVSQLTAHKRNIAVGFLLRNNYIDNFNPLCFVNDDNHHRISPLQLVGIDAVLFGALNTVLDVALAPVLVAKKTIRGAPFSVGGDMVVFDLSQLTMEQADQLQFSRDLENAEDAANFINNSSNQTTRLPVFANVHWTELGLGSLFAGSADHRPTASQNCATYWLLNYALVASPQRPSRWARRRPMFLAVEKSQHGSAIRKCAELYPVFRNVCAFL